MDASIFKQLKDEIDSVINAWVSGALKDRFMQKPAKQNTQSLWDRFKQGVSNWWWGPKGEEHNQYRWKNRFGNELGSADEQNHPLRAFDPSVFSLREYSEMRRIVDSIEIQLHESGEADKGFDKLRLMNILKSAAEDLKSVLYNSIKNKLIAAASVPSNTTEQPTAKSEPPAAGEDLKTGTTHAPRSKRAAAKPKPEAAASAGREAAAKPKPEAAASAEREAAAKTKPEVAASAGSTGAADGVRTTNSGGASSAVSRQLEDYFQDKSGRKSDKDIKNDILRFVRHISSQDGYTTHRKILHKWITSYLDKDDIRAEGFYHYLFPRIVSEDQFVAEISEITKKEVSEIKEKMIRYLDIKDAEDKKAAEEAAAKA